jgi:ubiquinone/menaquinone biosynthesis C-methylase UbiE
MIQYLHFLEQQSVDLVVSIASIQHLHYEKRQLLRNEVYRVLNYGGLHITTNRSYSKRMMTKHRSTIIAGLILQVLNHKTFGWNDYMIPFKEAKAKAKAKDVIAANGTLDGHTEELRAMPIKPGTKNQELRTKDQELITSYRFYHIYLLGSLIHYAHTA